jgi:integrase/recombinase XerD
MLETLFKQEVALQRHRSAPLLEERVQYLAHLQNEGTSINRLRIVAAMLLGAAAHLRLNTIQPIDKTEIERASERWVREPAGRRKSSVAGLSPAFILVASNWLRFHNALIEEHVDPPPFGDLLPEYLEFLAGPKAMTPATVNSYKSRAWIFLRWAARRYDSFESLTLNDIDEYLKELTLREMKPRAIASVCQTLKSLFKFCEVKGITQNFISAGIISPTAPRYDPEHKGPRWKDVRRMLAPAPGRTKISLRADAILVLFGIYGLRSIEISSLLLSDVDFEEHILTIRRAKGGRTQRFPLHVAAANALSDYLEVSRPACLCTNFFITHDPPYRATTHASLRCIVANRMKSLHIKSALMSTHALRHSCATELLNRGISMSEIARYLGHKDCRSVGVYAKCSKASIRAVADFSLEWVS